MEEVKEQLGNLRGDKAPDTDNMQPRVLLEVAEQVSEILNQLTDISRVHWSHDRYWRIGE